MTTATDSRTGFEVRSIAADVVRELLATDDAGRRAVVWSDDEGGAPLRCCLEPSRPGERVALVSYAPLRRWARSVGAEPGAYDEVGPVFVHAEACAGPDDAGYPAWLAGSRRVLRAYGHDGRIRGGRLIEPDADGSTAPAESAVAELFADPQVAIVHARALEFGCFTFEVWRTEASAGD